MTIQDLRLVFRLNAKLGRLYRGARRVTGTPKFEGGPLMVSFNGRQISYARVCYAMYHGYFPAQARHRNGKVQDNRIENLYDPAAAKAQSLPHAGKYRGVYATFCQYNGKLRGYRGAFYDTNRKRHYTPVVETPEIARDLLLLLKAQVEWQASQKETAQ